MAAYVMAYIEITDPVKYEDYRRHAGPAIEQYGGKFLARGGQLQTLEGDWHPERLVVVEFESVERAKQWYTSPEYSKAKHLRQNAATVNMILVEGV